MIIKIIKNFLTPKREYLTIDDLELFKPLDGLLTKNLKSLKK